MKSIVFENKIWIEMSFHLNENYWIQCKGYNFYTIIASFYLSIVKCK
jgi:hypothetical protein